MLKNIAWDTKEKKIAAVVFTAVVCGQLFFETMRVGFNEIWHILIIAAAGVAFSIFFITSIEGKWNRLFSAQGIIAAITIIAALGLAESHEVSNATIEGVYAMLISSVMLLVAQKIYLLPVAAAIGIVMAISDKHPDIQSVTMFSIPAAIALSCVSCSDKFKELAIWEKIIFALSHVVMLASFGHVIIYLRLHTITLNSFITQVWDSIVSAVAVVILLFLTVATVIKRRSIVQAFGYLLLAILSVIPMFMEMKYALISAMPMFMVLLFASKEGSVADEVFNGIIGLLNPKSKKKSKTKAKK